MSIPNIKKLLQQAWPERKILAIEIVGPRILGAVAVAKGKKITVSNFVTVERTSDKDDLPDPVNIEEIMDRLDYQDGPAVLVTPLARSVQISMNRAKVDKLRHYQLRDALRWEVEPYTGITGTQALIGAEKGSPAQQEELMLLAEEEEELDVNVSVTEQNVYRAMKQIFKRSGLKLVRLYPPEVCFFMPLFLEPLQGARAVFDIGADYANFTIVKGGQPKQINTYSLGSDVLLELMDGGYSEETEQSLNFLLAQVPGPLPLILTGTGGILPKISDYLDARCECGAKPLELIRSDKLGRADHESMNAIYAVVAGAAIRELSGRAWRRIGITDAVPLVVRLKQSAYLVPLGVTILFAIGLLGHYEFMKNRKGHYKVRSAELSVEVKKKKQQYSAYENLRGKSRELGQSIERIHQLMTFLSGGSDDNLSHIERVLKAFFSLPPEMLLESLSQEGNRYILQGKTDDFDKVGSFAVYLQQKYPWCRAVDIKVLEYDGDGRLQFRMDMDIGVEG